MGKISTEGFRCDFNRGEADSADCDAASFFQLFRKFPAGDGDPSVAFVFGNASYSSNFLDDAGEHKFRCDAKIIKHTKR